MIQFKIETFIYPPFTNSFNAKDVVRFTVNNPDLITLPSESVLMIAFLSTTTKADTADVVFLVSNCAGFLI